MDSCKLVGTIKVNGTVSAGTITAIPVISRGVGSRPAGAQVPANKVITVPSTGIIPATPTLDVPGGPGTWPADVDYVLTISASGTESTQTHKLRRGRSVIDLGTIDFKAPVTPSGGNEGGPASASDITTGTLIDSVIPANVTRDAELSAAVAGITKTTLGLGNVNNTADANKPVSTATATALAGKAATTHTHDEFVYIVSTGDDSNIAAALATVPAGRNLAAVKVAGT